MAELRGTFVCDFITGFHGKYCVTGEFMNSRQEKAEEPENLGNRIGKRQVRDYACTLPVGFVHGQRARTLIPEAARLPQTGFPAGYSDTATGYFYKSSPLQRSFPQMTPRGPSGLPARPSGRPRAPAARHGSGAVSLEGTRVIFSTKPRALTFITCAAL